MTPGQWERVTLGWQHALFAVALAVTTLNVFTSADHRPSVLALRLGLVGALGAWYGYWFGWRRDTSHAHLAYLIGAAALWAAMAAIEPALLAAGVAVLIPYCVRRPAWAAVAFVGLGGAWLVQRVAAGDLVSVAGLLTCGLGVVTAVTVVGYIATLDREGRRRQRLLDELAAARAGQAAAERWAGILAERQRLARDIHDTLTQGFASIALQLDAAHDDLPPNGPATRRVERARRAARENLAESRRLINALRPSQLDGSRLPDAVRRLTDRLTEETQLAARTVITGRPVTLADTVETQLLRVVQEALTNVRRHADAAEVTVTLSYMDDVVAIDVQDDGVGIATDPTGDGVGMASMRERITHLDGTLTVESVPGEGTTIALSVPVTTP